MSAFRELLAPHPGRRHAQRRLRVIGTEEELFNEDQLIASFNVERTVCGCDPCADICVQSINAVDYHQEVSIATSDPTTSSLRFTSYPAGHVLGAAMFLIEIAGIRVLYTGDYSTEEDRHLIPARVPDWSAKPDVMICESTYGVQSLEPRLEKEERFTSLPHPLSCEGRPT